MELGMDSVTLWDIPRGAPKSAYEEWDCQHPDVYAEFRRRTLALIEGGQSRYSAWTIISAIRFECDIRGGTPYKINNNIIAFLTRKFQREYPAHRDFFETRRSKLDL